MGCASSTIQKTHTLEGGVEPYEVMRTKLGSGTQAVVYEAVLKNSGRRRALKTTPKSRKAALALAENEVKVLGELSHPHIIQLHEHFADVKNIYCSLELCTGGDLFEQVLNRGNFEENESRNVIRQVLEAVNYLHGKQIMHRDVKPQNFLFTEPTKRVDNAILKLCDFGSCCRFGEDGQKFRTDMVGEPYYVAPEVLNRRYNEKADVWSCGVLLYLVVCGYPPFCGDHDSEVLAKVKKGTFKFTPNDWQHVTKQTMELVTSLLTKHQPNRPTAAKALENDWLNTQISPAMATTVPSSGRTSPSSDEEEEKEDILGGPVGADDVVLEDVEEADGVGTGDATRKESKSTTSRYSHVPSENFDEVGTGLVA